MTVYLMVEKSLASYAVLVVQLPELQGNFYAVAEFEFGITHFCPVHQGILQYSFLQGGFPEFFLQTEKNFHIEQPG